EQRAHGRAGDAVLAGAGLGHDARLAHVLHEQRLAEGVVDLVGARVAQVFPLQPHARAEPLRQPPGESERRRPPHVVAKQTGELVPEGGIAARLGVRRLQLSQRLHERLRHVSAAIRAEVPLLVGPRRGHLSASRTAAMKARTLSASLRPGAASTPLETSTPSGRTALSARWTLSGLRPPASIRNEAFSRTARARVQSKLCPLPPAGPASVRVSSRMPAARPS